MNCFKLYIASSRTKIYVFAIFLIFACIPSFSQNTKGDRPVNNRENRFKTPVRKTSQHRRTPGKKRVQPKSRSVANSGDAHVRQREPHRKERAGRSIKPIFTKRKPQNKQKAWRGDISGRRLRTKDASSSKSNVYPQTGRYVRKTVPERHRTTKGIPGGGRVTVKSRTGKTKNVYSQHGVFTNNTHTKPRTQERAVSNRTQLSRLNRLQADPNGTPTGRKKKVTPRSASRSFIARRSINVYANFPRPKRRAENAWTKDVAGKPLRAKNYETPRPGVISPTYKPYYGRKRVGDRPYRGPAAGKYRTATKPGERAWTGDIAKRRIRHRDKSSKRSIEGTPILSGGYKSATRSGEARTGLSPLPPKRPKTGGLIGGFPGKIKRFEQSPGFSDQGEEFTGNLKARRPKKGGGSVSGKLWNNDERSVTVRTSGESARAASFQGNIKTKRPQKGGGSVSGKLWNNNETPIPVRTPPESARKEGRYPGNIKMFELKPGFSDQGEEFTGYIKLKKFRKNYLQNDYAAKESIKKKRIDKNAYKAEGLQIKVARRDYIKNPNTAEGGLLKLKPTESTKQAGELQVKVKQYSYKQNPSSAEGALKVREPGKVFARATDYQGNIKMQKFTLFEKNKALHPDAKFIKTNKNNVSDERDMLTNLKLWWARLFKKEETQPDHLKDTGKKPRYDKGEEGLWYE